LPVLGFLGVLGAAACTDAAPAASPTSSLPPAESPTRLDPTTAATGIPEPTGVPGLTAADPLCAAWAAYVGTVQALGIAASFGSLPSDQFAVLELQAAPRFVEIAAAIETAWPAELASERTLVLDQRIGPYTRRAQHAVDALTAAGVTAGELAMLTSNWQTALSGRDPDAAVIQVPTVGADLEARLDAAATAYNAAFTPFAQDPSLVVDAVKTPATDAYLMDHCPDLVSSGVGDAL
jgi:hypothetical protein